MAVYFLAVSSELGVKKVPRNVTSFSSFVIIYNCCFVFTFARCHRYYRHLFSQFLIVISISVLPFKRCRAYIVKTRKQRFRKTNLYLYRKVIECLAEKLCGILMQDWNRSRIKSADILRPATPQQPSVSVAILCSLPRALCFLPRSPRLFSVRNSRERLYRTST